MAEVSLFDLKAEHNLVEVKMCGDLVGQAKCSLQQVSGACSEDADMGII